MFSSNPLNELKTKVPELQNQLIQTRIYFYPNIKDDEFCINLLIYEANKSPYKFIIREDISYQVLTPAPEQIIDYLDAWLTTFDTVKNRQQQRTQLLKEELIMKIWHPDYINSPIMDL